MVLFAIRTDRKNHTYNSLYACDADTPHEYGRRSFPTRYLPAAALHHNFKRVEFKNGILFPSRAGVFGRNRNGRQEPPHNANG